MNLLPEHLKKDFERNERKINNSEYPKEYIIKPVDVLKAHYLTCDYFESFGESVLYGVRDINLLCSAVGRQMTTFGGKSKWQHPLEKCATLYYGLVKNHAFHDGNKRTALLSTLYYLHLIGRTPTGQQKNFESLTVAIAANELSKYKEFMRLKDAQDKEIITISKILTQLTREADHRYYALTFKEFNHKLQIYGYYLSNPSGNYINVCTKKKSFWGAEKEIKIYQIGFPGWTKQINRKAAMCVLKETGLNMKMDSYSFFKGGEPLYKLIQDYEGPLMRLRDK